MSLTLLILGGAALLWALVWIYARFSQPANFTQMSDAWIDAHKYDRKHARPD